MVKLVQCIRRRPAMTVEEFRAAWEGYGERLRDVAIELGASRVTLSTTLETPLNDALAAARGSIEPFDGVAEIAWPRGTDLLTDATNPATRARIARLRGLQETFAEPGHSAFFFVHEQSILDDEEISSS
jgi:hypothetical protein